jgi:hypothetical protein
MTSQICERCTYLQLFEKSNRKVHEVVLPKPGSPKQPVKGKRLPRRKGPDGTVHEVRRTGQSEVYKRISDAEPVNNDTADPRGVYLLAVV